MRRKGMALFSAAAVVVGATGIQVGAVASQESSHQDVSPFQPVETYLGSELEGPRTAGAPPATSVHALEGTESDIGGLGCVGEDGSISLVASREEAEAQYQCPKFVWLDDFEDVDYGPNTIGATACRLTEEYDAKEGQKFVAKVSATIKAIFGGELEGQGWRETHRKRCVYHGCDLDLSMSEATWSAQT